MSLEHLVSLDNYVPSIYKDVREIQELIKSEDYLFDILISIVDKEYARMFIQTSDLAGVEKFERVLQITADPTIETLEFRKERLLTRCNSTLPYSTIWLRIFLNSVLGEHNYELSIDYKNDIIRLYGYLVNYSWSKEATRVIRQTKPCNMIFINIPTLIENIGFMYWQDNNTWNDSSWNDENVWEELKYLSSDEIINYKQEPATSEGFKIPYETINTIKLNNNKSIKNIKKSIKDDTMYIEFTVPNDIKLLESVEVIDRNGTTMVSNECYIDTPSGTNIVMRLLFYRNKD